MIAHGGSTVGNFWNGNSMVEMDGYFLELYISFEAFISELKFCNNSGLSKPS